MNVLQTVCSMYLIKIFDKDVSKDVAESIPPMGSMRFEMGKHDSSWRRVWGFSSSVVRCLVIVTVFGQCAGGKPISETLQRALSAVRGPSPGAKKLLNIPEDGGASIVLSETQTNVA
ncbi:hypothetical protein HF086_016460 [Spodoptera exigua]|uniref:Uncharacterized protein n=1 Tax=Spodoptera exigua TaxID=7107 RepID=A0A922SN77_SPOEX|nr:hypothetical protein HF086_016460 [Spodoptera exigua]